MVICNFKGHIPFIFITKYWNYWLLSMCYTIYPGSFFFLRISNVDHF